MLVHVHAFGSSLLGVLLHDLPMIAMAPKAKAPEIFLHLIQILLGHGLMQVVIKFNRSSLRSTALSPSSTHTGRDTGSMCVKG